MGETDRESGSGGRTQTGDVPPGRIAIHGLDGLVTMLRNARLSLPHRAPAPAIVLPSRGARSGATTRFLDTLDPASDLSRAVRLVESEARSRAVRKVWRCGMAKFVAYCSEVGLDPADATTEAIDGAYNEWLMERVGNAQAMKGYARKLVRALAAVRGRRDPALPAGSRMTAMEVAIGAGHPAD